MLKGGSEIGVAATEVSTAYRSGVAHAERSPASGREDNHHLPCLNSERYFFSPPTKLASNPVNSMGKMYLVEGLAPNALSVSKYCSVIVF